VLSNLLVVLLWYALVIQSRNGHPLDAPLHRTNLSFCCAVQVVLQLNSMFSADKVYDVFSSTSTSVGNDVSYLNLSNSLLVQTGMEPSAIVLW